MTNATTEMQTVNEARDLARMVESLVMRGDISALSPEHRVRFYVQTCEGLGLNPHSQPFAFLKLNGKEVMYATRGATDQLAAMHRIDRKIIDGPKIVDIAGAKVAYCVAEARHPNGRTETATATLPVTDPPNLYMKLETKAKRRVTLSILGLGKAGAAIRAGAQRGQGQQGGTGARRQHLEHALAVFERGLHVIAQRRLGVGANP